MKQVGVGTIKIALMCDISRQILWDLNTRSTVGCLVVQVTDILSPVEVEVLFVLFV